MIKSQLIRNFTDESWRLEVIRLYLTVRNGERNHEEDQDQLVAHATLVNGKHVKGNAINWEQKNSHRINKDQSVFVNKNSISQP